MDDHPSGYPQGPGGQNPAYRPTHRHNPSDLHFQGFEAVYTTAVTPRS
jgi:hypothetical protein